MKEISKEFLMDYIKKCVCQDVLDYDMYKIFKLYSAFEVTNDDNVLGAIDDFQNFWETNIQSIRCEDETIRPKLEEYIRFNISSLKQTITNARTIFHKQFAEIVKTLSPTKYPAILDVGSGNYPYSSILLGQKEVDVSSIDMGFYLSNNSLESMNVYPIISYFNENTNVDNYDFVVGRYPCTAIEHIVQNCKNANKPYFIQLCSCNAPELEVKPKFSWLSWQELLLSIDPNIKFFRNYAFNIDATSEQVETIVRQIRRQRVFYPSAPLDREVYRPANVTRSYKPIRPALDDEELEK